MIKGSKRVAFLVRKGLGMSLCMGICFVMALGVLCGMPKDSIRVERHGALTFVIHRIGEGETLYGLARRYKASIEGIIHYNKGVEVLHIGAEVYIPTTKIKDNHQGYHQVKEGDNLYNIAQHYGFEVLDLKHWNGLKDNNINIGQVLHFAPFPLGEALDVAVVGEKSSSAPKVATSSKAKAPDGAVVREKSPKESSSAPKVAASTKAKAPLRQANAAFQKPLDSQTEYVQEEGIAMRIPYMGKGNRGGYYALHREAAIGTFVKVRNLLNGKDVLARVIGRVADIDSHKEILIQLSDAAYKSLQTRDKKTRVWVIRASP